MDEYMIPCLSKKLFGIDCLGCGTQRALVMLFHGDFVAAFHMFPAIYTTLLFCFFVFLNVVDKSRNYNRLLIVLAIVNVTIMIISYIYKITNH